MEGFTRPGRPAIDAGPRSPGGPPERDPWSPAPAAGASPGASRPRWPAWTAPAALFAGLALAAVGALVVDLPAIALGAHLTTSHTPPGLAIADTFVQDLAFILAAVFFAQLGGRAARAWQFGLRPPRGGWGRPRMFRRRPRTKLRRPRFAAECLGLA